MRLSPDSQAVCLRHWFTGRHLHAGLNPRVLPFVRCAWQDNTAVAMCAVLEPVNGFLCNGASIRIFWPMRKVHLGLDDASWPITWALPAPFCICCCSKQTGEPLTFGDAITVTEKQQIDYYGSTRSKKLHVDVYV